MSYEILGDNYGADPTMGQSPSDTDKITVVFTILPSSLLRGAPLNECTKSITVNPSNDNIYLYKGLLNLFKSTFGASPEIGHYLYSPKLKLFIFINFSNNHGYLPISDDLNPHILKFLIKPQSNIKILGYFIKNSSIEKFGLQNLVNSIIEKLNNEMKVQDILSTESPNVEQISKILKDYIDPLHKNWENNLFQLLENLHDIKTAFSNNFSTNVGHLQRKIDNICSNFNTSDNTSNNQNNKICFKSSVPRCNVTHTNVLCDGCSESITGFRFKCLECFDYDLCEKCDSQNFESIDHLKTHQMLRIWLDEKPIIFVDNAISSEDLVPPYPVNVVAHKTILTKNLSHCYNIKNDDDVSAVPGLQVPDDGAFAAIISTKDNLTIDILSIFQDFNIQLSVSVSGVAPIENLSIDSKSNHMNIQFGSLCAFPMTIADISSLFLMVSSYDCDYVFEMDSTSNNLQEIGGKFRELNDVPKQNPFDDTKAYTSYYAKDYTSDAASFETIKLNSKDHLSPASVVQIEFESLGYSLSNLDDELQIRIRSNIPTENNELISLTINDSRGNYFTSELVDEGYDSLIATFSNWVWDLDSNTNLEFHNAIVHYKACDYEILIGSSIQHDFQCSSNYANNDVLSSEKTTSSTPSHSVPNSVPISPVESENSKLPSTPSAAPITEIEFSTPSSPQNSSFSPVPLTNSDSNPASSPSSPSSPKPEAASTTFKFPTIETTSDQDYVFISRSNSEAGTKSEIDKSETESDYSVLSMDENF